VEQALHLEEVCHPAGVWESHPEEVYHLMEVSESRTSCLPRSLPNNEAKDEAAECVEAQKMKGDCVDTSF